MRIAPLSVAVLGALALASPALAQTKKMRPGTTLTVVNERQEVAIQVAVAADDKIVRSAKPLAPKGRAVLKLPKLTGCTVTVSAAFAGEDAMKEIGEVDVCREKSVRLTD
jgi:hypothetical protein